MTHLIRAQVGEVLLGERKQKISLFHRILLTFHDACDMRDIDVAMRLLKILESMAIAAARAHRATVLTCSADLWLPMSVSGTCASTIRSASIDDVLGGCMVPA
jgi:hypothetical protein